MQDLVYLAGPVDGVSEPERSGWRQAMGHALIRRGLIGYSPAAPWMAAQEEAVEHASTVDAINRHVINRSVGLIANLAGVGRGIGTIREILGPGAHWSAADCGFDGRVHVVY
jgi:nucleoside 2-deoxyribosyltransferase